MLLTLNVVTNPGFLHSMEVPQENSFPGHEEALSPKKELAPEFNPQNPW